MIINESLFASFSSEKEESLSLFASFSQEKEERV
jgi:hypothetical protein